jgi:hypothetical protein
VVYNRKAIAPWSLEREQGIESATVDSNIETPQYLQPVVNTGVINKDGNWIGVETSDKLFTIDPPHLAIPNGAAVLSPQRADHEFIDMTGFENIFIAIKVSNGGNYATAAVMGPSTYSFANLTPVNGGANLKGAVRRNDMDNLLVDSSDNMTADVWNIFIIKSQLSNQKLLQFSITNNSGAESNIEFAYQRVV